MTCDQANQVHAYHDGEWPREAARALESHLAACSDCRVLLTELRGLSGLVGGAALPAMRPMAAARHYGAWTDARDRGLVRVTGWLTAVAASVLIGALGLWRGGEPPRNIARPAAMWETFAVIPPADTQAESTAELVQVAQFMADDLSLGGGSAGGGERR